MALFPASASLIETSRVRLCLDPSVPDNSLLSTLHETSGNDVLPEATPVGFQRVETEPSRPFFFALFLRHRLGRRTPSPFLRPPFLRHRLQQREHLIFVYLA